MAVREAREVCSVHGDDVAAWCGSKYDDCLHQIRVGDVIARSGDWVIREPDGSFRVAQLSARV